MVLTSIMFFLVDWAVLATTKAVFTTCISGFLKCPSVLFGDWYKHTSLEVA